MNKRIAIVCHPALSPGEAANAAAIVAGQIGSMTTGYFADEPVQGGDDAAHAGVQYSVVALKAKNGSQLRTLAKSAGPDAALVFGRTGQALNNAFEQYQQAISKLTIDDEELIVVAVYGAEDEVLSLTKKFSLLK